MMNLKLFEPKTIIQKMLENGKVQNNTNTISIKDLIEQLKQNSQVDQYNQMQEVTDKLTESINPLQEMLDKLNMNMDKLNPLNDIKETLEPISKLCHILTNPMIIWKFIAGSSYWVIVIGSVICIIMVACGHKGAKKWIPTGFVIYTIIQAINGVIS